MASRLITLAWGKCSTTDWTTAAGKSLFTFLPFPLLVPAIASRLIPMTLRWSGKCSTTVLLLLANQCSLFASPSPGYSDGVQTHTLDLVKARQVFYHCTTGAGQSIFTFGHFFSRCQWLMLDSKPWPCEGEATVLPLAELLLLANQWILFCHLLSRY